MPDFLRASWEEVYAIQQTTQINEWPKFSDTQSVGYLGISNDSSSSTGKFILPIMNRPNIPDGFSRTRLSKRSELANRGEDDFHLEWNPSQEITLDMPLNSYNFSLFMWLLMHNGASEASNGSQKTATFIPYTSADPEVYCTVVKVETPRTTNRQDDHHSPVALGCICKSITISGAQGEVVTMTANLITGSLTRYNVIGLLSNRTNFRLNRYPVATGYSVTVGTIEGESDSVNTYSADEVATDDNFRDAKAMSDNEIEWSLATGNFNFAQNLLDTFGSKDLETMIYTDLGAGSYDSALWSALDTVANKSYVKYQDFTFQTNFLTGSNQGSDTYYSMDVTNFTINIDNNARSYPGTNQRVNKFTLGSLDITGSLTLSMQGNPYKATDTTSPGPVFSGIRPQAKGLRIFSGTTYDSTQDGDISFAFPYYVTSAERDFENSEIVEILGFEGVNSTSYTDFFFKCSYDSSILIRGIT